MQRVVRSPDKYSTIWEICLEMIQKEVMKDLKYEGLRVVLGYNQGSLVGKYLDAALQPIPLRNTMKIKYCLVFIVCSRRIDGKFMS